MWAGLRKLRWRSWGLSAWVFAYFAYLCANRIDLDYGWHFRSGQYILAHGVPRRDIFSYTAANFPWVDHEWLNDVFMYAVAHRLGYGVLALMMAAVWAAAVMLAVKSWRVGWTTAGLALGALLLYVGVRPVTWTALGLVLTLRLLDGARGRYWLLVPLFGVWANLHAGFALGLALVALRAVMDRSWRLAMAGMAGLGATLVNPYGFGVYVELWRTMSDSKLAGRIVEWGPLAVNYAVAPYVLGVIVVLIVMRGRRFARICGAGLVVAAIWANRQLPLMVVGTLGLVHVQIECGWAEAQRILPHRKVWWARIGLAVVAGVIFPLAVLQWPPRTNGGINVQPPVLALRQLRADPCQGHVFNDYNFGGFMIWWLPGVPVYIDGRMPSWRGPQGSYLDRYVQVLKGGATSDQEFARYNVQCALLTRYDDRLSKHLGRQSGWRLVLKADGTELWRRD